MPIKLFDPNVHGATPIIKGKIIDMVKEYKKELRAGETKSAWVNKEEIFALLDQNDGSSGIRVYFGRYPEKDAAYPGQMNIILVATESKETKPGSVDSVNMLNDDLKEGPIDSVSFVPSRSKGEYTGSGDDSIPLCPQHCPTIDL